MTSVDWQLRCAELKQRGAYLYQTKLWSDCSFQLNDVTIKAHKLIMAMASPVFAEMVYGSFAKFPMPIYDVRPEVFNILLQYIYSDDLNIDSSKDACDVYYAAKKWRMPYVANKCVKYLNQHMSPENVCHIYQVACECGDTTLQTTCEKIFSTRTKEILNDESFYDIDLSIIKKLFTLEPLNIDSELDLFQAIVKYAEKHQNNTEITNISSRSNDEDGNVSDSGPSPAKRTRYSQGNIQNEPHADCSLMDLERSSIEADESSQNAQDSADKVTVMNTKGKEKYRDLVNTIRFLTLSPPEFAECSSLASLLSESELLALSMNIASKETLYAMPEGLSKCMVPRTQTTKEDRTRLAAVYRSLIHNFKHMRRYESMPFYLRNLAWTMMVLLTNENIYVFVLTCFFEEGSPDWLKNCRVKLKFCTHKSVPNHKISLKLTLLTKEYGGWVTKLYSDELLNPEYGFIDDFNSVMYKVYINTVPRTHDGADADDLTDSNPISREDSQSSNTEAIGSTHKPTENTSNVRGTFKKMLPVSDASLRSCARPSTPIVTNVSQTRPSSVVTTQSRPSPTVTTQSRPSPTVTTQSKPSPTVTTQSRPSPTVTTQSRPSPTVTTQSRPSPRVTTLSRPSIVTSGSRPSPTVTTLSKPSIATSESRPSPTVTTLSRTSIATSESRPSPTVTTLSRPSIATSESRPSPTVTTLSRTSIATSESRPSPTVTTLSRPSIATSESRSSPTVTTQSRLFPIVTTQSRLSPIVTTQSRLSPIVTTQSKPSPIVTTQCRLSPIVTTQSRLSPIVTTQSRPSPIVTTQCRLSPIVTTQSRLSPIVTTQSRPSPIVTTQSRLSPIVTTQSRPSPMVTSQSKPSPMLTPQFIQSPVSTHFQSRPASTVKTQSGPMPMMTTESQPSPILTTQSRLIQTATVSSKSGPMPMMSTESRSSPIVTTQSQSRQTSTVSSELRPMPMMPTESRLFPIETTQSQSRQTPTVSSESRPMPMMAIESQPSPIVTTQSHLIITATVSSEPRPMLMMETESQPSPIVTTQSHLIQTPTEKTESRSIPVMATESRSFPTVTIESHLKQTPTVTSEPRTIPIMATESRPCPIVTTQSHLIQTPTVTSEPRPMPMVTTESRSMPMMAIESRPMPMMAIDSQPSPIVTTQSQLRQPPAAKSESRSIPVMGTESRPMPMMAIESQSSSIVTTANVISQPKIETSMLETPPPCESISDRLISSSSETLPTMSLIKSPADNTEMCKLSTIDSLSPESSLTGTSNLKVSPQSRITLSHTLNVEMQPLSSSNTNIPQSVKQSPIDSSHSESLSQSKTISSLVPSTSTTHSLKTSKSTPLPTRYSTSIDPDKSHSAKTMSLACFSTMSSYIVDPPVYSIPVNDDVLDMSSDTNTIYHPSVSVTASQTLKPLHSVTLPWPTKRTDTISTDKVSLKDLKSEELTEPEFELKQPFFQPKPLKDLAFTELKMLVSVSELNNVSNIQPKSLKERALEILTSEILFFKENLENISEDFTLENSCVVDNTDISDTEIAFKIPPIEPPTLMNIALSMLRRWF